MSCNEPQAELSFLLALCMIPFLLFGLFCLPFLFYHIVIPHNWWMIRLAEMNTVEGMLWIALFYLSIVKIVQNIIKWFNKKYPE